MSWLPPGPPPVSVAPGPAVAPPPPVELLGWALGVPLLQAATSSPTTTALTNGRDRPMSSSAATEGPRNGAARDSTRARCRAEGLDREEPIEERAIAPNRLAEIL